MHNTLQGGLHYKLAFYSDTLPLGAVHIALFNEIVEVVRLDVSDRLTTPEQVSEMVHQIDLFWPKPAQLLLMSMPTALQMR